MAHRETPEFADMLERMIAAYGRRVADADPVDLARMVRLRESFDVAIGHAVIGQRDRHSWSQIGEALGVSRQAAWERWRA